MLMTVFVAVGLNAPSLPLLPLLTCARPLAGSPATSMVTQKMIEESLPARHCVASFFISYTPVQKPLCGFHLQDLCAPTPK